MESTQIKNELEKIIEGDVFVTDDVLEKYSTDASLFRIKPKAVVFPKTRDDIKKIVVWASEQKNIDQNLSITARSAGTDMSGGAVNDSIILDFTKYLNKIIEVNGDFAVAEPGCFYRDFEKETLKFGSWMPSYTASREICAIGGMVANNAGGENTIKHGKVENHIKYLKAILTDGKEYKFEKISKKELENKISQNDFEGQLYKNIYNLILQNKDEIKNAKPDVSKNSAGYYLWNVWDEEQETFDMTRVLVGSQGTLGIITEIAFNLTKKPKNSGLLAIFLKDLEILPRVVNEVMKYKPDSFESYDDYSLKLAVKFFFDFFKQMGFIKAVKLGFQFIPEAMLMLTNGVPKLTLLVQFTGESEDEVKKELLDLKTKIDSMGLKSHLTKSEIEAEKYWEIRRQSFNMLRKHVHNKRTAPFVDDLIVKPEYLPKILPEVEKILDENKLIYTVAGHAGDGNFHIIPLMDLNSPFSKELILRISDRIYDLVLKYKGSITAEHNDGIIRTPYLYKMYSEKIISLFKQTKDIFDKQNILNPNKKVGGTVEDIKRGLER
jgi:FAD/FMN-containing dehydrogenase